MGGHGEGVDQREGIEIDRQKLREPNYPRAFLPKRWIVQRTFSWLGQNRRMSLWTTSVCRRAEKRLIYVAMSRLMARRLARP